MDIDSTLRKIRDILPDDIIGETAPELSLEDLPGIFSSLVVKLKQNQKWQKRLEEENRYLKNAGSDITAFQALANNITSSRKLEWIFELLIFTSKKIIPFNSSAILLFKGEEKNKTKRELVFAKKNNIDTEIGNAIEKQISNGVIDWVVDRKEIVFIDASTLIKNREKPFFIIIPIFSSSEVLGALIICGDFPVENLSQQTTNMLSYLMFQTSVGIENLKTYQKMEGEIENMGTLFESLKSMTSILELNELIGLVLSLAIEELDMDGGMLFLLEDRNLKAEVGVDVEDSILENLVYESGKCALDEEKTLYINDTHIHIYDFMKDFKSSNLKHMISFPLKTKNKILGVVSLFSNKTEKPKQKNTLIETMSDYSSICIDNAIAFEKTEKLSLIDELSQLYNSRHFFIALDREIERSRRYNKPLSLIFIDVDRFKSVNDKYGHLMGSEVLREIGTIIRETVRHPDIPCRYGGDEYTVILPETDEAGGTLTANRIRENVANNTFLSEYKLELSITVSLGVSTFPALAKSKKELIETADKALYIVKKKKGNMAVIWSFDAEE